MVRAQTTDSTAGTDLLTREQFRTLCMERDGHRCVLCRAAEGLAVHHIMDRALWGNGGYYLLNGATVCESCHLRCEQTLVSCEEVRSAARIEKVLLPEHLEGDIAYTKWGDAVLEDGKRLPGEMFEQPSVQKVLAPVLHLYTPYRRAPRTYHLPWSLGRASDDKVLPSVSQFDGEDVVVTVKLDGENTSIYNNYIHARSLDSRSHVTRDWVKNFVAGWQHELPDGWRVVGENLWGVHSIKYRHLDTYFYVHSIWNERNRCLSWDDTFDYASMLGLKTVPVWSRGLWNEDRLQRLYRPVFDDDPCEGYVVRVAREFSYTEYRTLVGKFVRENHVPVHARFWRERVEKNELHEQ